MLLSQKDRSDLGKFLKYFVYKSFHALLQSRSGRKVNDRSKLIASGSDWFNLLVRDEASLQTEVKKAYHQLGGLQVARQPISIEFALKVKSNGVFKEKEEENRVVLEGWSVRMGGELDSATKVSFGVYNRLSTLLKSLLVVSRTLPFYRLRTAANNLDITYSVVVGEVRMRGGVEFEVGRVGTPLGTVIVSSYTNVRALQNLRTAIRSSDVVTDGVLLDHFSNDFFEFDDPPLPHHATLFSCRGDEDGGDDGGDIVSVSKDDEGNVIIKNQQHEDEAGGGGSKNGFGSTKDHNSPLKSNKTNLNNDLTNNNVFNNNYKHTNVIQEGVDGGGNKDEESDEEDEEGGEEDEEGGEEDEEGGKKFLMVNYEDFEDLELGQFYKQFKEAEQFSMFNSDNKMADEALNGKSSGVLCGKESACHGVKKKDGAADKEGDEEGEDEMHSLSTTLAEFEANAVHFDAFVQSIDNVMMIK